MRLIFHFNLLLVGFVTARIAFTTYQIVFGLDLAPTFYIFISNQINFFPCKLRGSLVHS